jgi:hypothetical protein
MICGSSFEPRSKVYVASSWRNTFQPAVVAACLSAGMEVYDFKADGAGFSWKQVDPGWQDDIVKPGGERIPADMSFNRIERMLAHPRAMAGFARDYLAMQQADTFVMVLPCGRSAHLELGWAIGQGKRTAILNMEDNPEPDLMVLMADYRTDNLLDLLAWMGVRDDPTEESRHG